MATRPKAVIESRNGEKFSPITITKNVLTDDGQNLHDILSDRKEDMMTPTIENSSSMFKVGQGDNVDYSENVVNGAYESLVFKGKSLVNLGKEINSQYYNISGEGTQITSDGYFKIPYAGSENSHSVRLKFGLLEPLIKPDTVYSLIVEIAENTTQNARIGFTGHNNLSCVEPVDTNTNIASAVGTHVKLIKRRSEVTARQSDLYFCIWDKTNVDVTKHIKFRYMILEGDWTNKELPPYFEGICDCKSPILSNVGKNLFTTRDSNIETNPNHKLDVLGENHIEITATTNDTGWLYTTYKVKGLVPNTTYILSGDVLEGTNNSSGSKGVMLIHDFNTSTSSESVDSSNRAIRYTTPKDVTKVRVLFYSSRNQTPNKIGDTYSFKNIQLEKATSPTAYEPYKSNILSCNGDKIELTEDMFEQGGVYFTKGQSFANATNNTAPDRIRLKTLLNLKPNTTYRVAIDNAYKVGVQLYNNEKLAVNDTGWVSDTTFTTKGGESAVALVIRKLSSAASISMSDFKNIKLQLSEVDKTIVLRSLPNGVCDTLNVETGEYVQRIGEVVLDGSENWMFYGATGGGVTTAFKLSLTGHISAWMSGNGYCDRLKFVSGDYIYRTNNEGITTDANNFVIRVLNEKASTIEELKSCLQSNPLTVQYELVTPIIKTVDLSGYPFAYKNGHVILSSGSIEQSLTPTVEYSVVTNRNGQIRSNQKMVERQQKELDHLQVMILANLVNTQYEQTLTNLKYDLKNVREEVK